METSSLNINMNQLNDVNYVKIICFDAFIFITLSEEECPKILTYKQSSFYLC